MYYKAARQQRVGMEGHLVWTLTPDHAQAVLDEYAHLFPTDVARLECFEKMLLLDKIATKVQGEREERMREFHRQKGGGPKTPKRRPGSRR